MNREMNRDGILGRPRAGERPSSDEVAALEKAPAAPQPAAKPPARAERVHVKASAITWRWLAKCPRCGFKVAGLGNPAPGQRLAKCGGCKRTLFLAERGR